MYKTIQTSIPAGQSNTPIIDVPGKLLGVAFQLPDTSASLRVRISTPLGMSLVINDQNTIVGVPATPPSPIYQVVPGMPVGSAQYQVGITAVQTGVTPVVLLYEDTPTVY